jgi:biopolymer transport protein ExbB
MRTVFGQQTDAGRLIQSLAPLACLLFVLLALLTLVPLEQVFAAEPDSPEKGLWIVQVFFKGGPVMYPIFICSVLGVAICLERGYHLRTNLVLHPEFIKEIRSYWVRREFDRVLTTCKMNDFPIARILKAGLLRADFGLLETERAIESAGAHEAARLGANLKGLGVVANLAPMLGLLGTVTGMIRAFNVISQSGTGDPALVAAGISEALITTATGLIVGIPALAFYHYYRSRVDQFIYEMEEISLEFLEEITHSIRQEEASALGKETPV